LSWTGRGFLFAHDLFRKPAPTFRDHAVELWDAAGAAKRALVKRAAAASESIQSYFDTEPRCAKLRATGFRMVDDIGPEQIAARFLPEIGTGARRQHHTRVKDLSEMARSADTCHARIQSVSAASISSR
jgi:hypothetical protein